MDDALSGFHYVKMVKRPTLPCLRCETNFLIKKKELLNEILPDNTTYVRLHSNKYHHILHQCDEEKRLHCYMLETWQISMLVMLAKRIQSLNDMYGIEIEELRMTTIKIR